MTKKTEEQEIEEWKNDPMYQELQSIKNHKEIKKKQTFEDFLEEASQEAFFSGGGYIDKA